MNAVMRYSIRTLMLLALAASMAACDNLTPGPSLSNVTLSAFGKEPTTDQRDPSLCCCRATGTATNRNAVPVYISITFSDFDAKGTALQKALFFLPDVAPGQTAAIDAPGFLAPCNAIDHFTAEVKVRGLTDPPL